MSYSCSDFTDDILTALGETGLLKGKRVPPDNPRGQARIAIRAVYALVAKRDELADVLTRIRDELATQFTGMWTERLDTLDQMAEQALANVSKQRATEALTSVLIVRRDSADGPENDVFTDYGLAQEWGRHIGEPVEEETIIDRATLEAMKETIAAEEQP